MIFRLTMRAVVLGVLSLTLLQPSRAQDNSSLIACKAIADRAADLVKAGEKAKARALRPQLEECIRLQRAELNRAARQIWKDYKASVGN